jgi:nucleoside-diphosphate-sugar epimerase
MSEVVLVTGAGGFVGRHLAAALAGRGHLVQQHTRRDGDIARCPLTHPDTTCVFHLAARTFVPESWASPLLFYETNVLGTVNVLEFCRRRGAALALISSYVYGKPCQLPIPETHPVEAFNPYSHSKILAEEAARYYQRQFGVRVAIIRPFNVYGPRQGGHFLIPSLLEQAFSPRHEFIAVQDDRPQRDYLFVSDFVEMLLLVLDARASGVYNAGTGRSVSVRELVDSINSLAPKKKPLRSKGEARPDEVFDVVADIRKAQQELGWRPRTTLLDGLQQTIGAMRAALQVP